MQISLKTSPYYTAEVFRTNRSGNSEPPIPLHISLLDFIRKITYGKYKKQPDFQEIIVQLEIWKSA